MRCLDVLLSGAIPKISAEVLSALQSRDNGLLREARQKGKCSVNCRVPAKRVKSAAASRSATLAQAGLCSASHPICTGGGGAGASRKRFASDPASGDIKRIKNSGSPFVPVKRVSCKTSILDLQHALAKRLKVKSSSNLLFRGV